MNALQELIRELGGPATLARSIGRTTEHVTAMRRRNSIPVRYWPSLMEAAQQKGFHLNEAKLLAIHIEAKALIKVRAE